jgi:hypothetical protein
MMIPSTHASLLHALQQVDQEARAAFQARYRDVILGWGQRRACRTTAPKTSPNRCC